jgi:ribonucleoside-diphosphate reductase beta chain
MSNKYTLFPIQHQTLWNFYKKHQATFWTVEEIRLNDDLNDWENKLNDNERYFIKNVLAFFAASDGIVNENLVVNFYEEIENAEARAFYTMQMLIETIHSEQYSILIDTYIKDQVEKDHLFNAIDTIPVIKKKTEWALKWISSGKDEKISDTLTRKISNFFDIKKGCCLIYKKLI